MIEAGGAGDREARGLGADVGFPVSELARHTPGLTFGGSSWAW